MKNNTSYRIEDHKANLVKMVERKNEILSQLALGKRIDNLNLPDVEFIKPV